MAKKNKIFKVTMDLEVEEEEIARNIFLTFREITRDFLKPVGGIVDGVIEYED